MNDDRLKELLNRADERFQQSAQTDAAATTLIAAVRRQHAKRAQTRNRLGALAAFVVLVGFSAWSLSGRWRRSELNPDSVATNEAHKHDAIQPERIDRTTQAPQLSADDVARLKAEIAALEAEATRTHRFVKLLQAAELRQERLAQAEAITPPALSPQALADLEIDRAAGITLIGADAEANKFHRPADAAESYRSVLKHFPSSRWATIARARLDEPRM
jgi:hypothetical protein